MVDEPALVGRTFGDLLLAYDTSSVIGVLRGAGGVELNPPADRVLGADDRIVLITEDDDTATRAERPPTVDEEAIVVPRTTTWPPERFLLLGWNHRAPLVVAQLDRCVPDGSTLVVMAEGEGPLEEAGRCARLPGRRMRVTVHSGDITDPRNLDELDVLSFDRAIVLGYDEVSTAPGGSAVTTGPW